MGLRVEKTLVRKKKAEADVEDDTTKVMFDLEKVNMEDIIAPSRSKCSPTRETVIEIEEGEANATGGSSPVDIFKLDEKARVTFDDILSSLQAKEKTVNNSVVSSDDELHDNN